MVAFVGIGTVRVQAQWNPVFTYTNASFRGVHVAGKAVWISGTKGTILRSSDEGRSWTHCAVPPGAAELDFRSVWAFDEQRAFVLSSGPGNQSKLYKTSDRCGSWTPVLNNDDKQGFWDGLVFSSSHDGFILGDPVDDQFVLLRTFDGGAHWIRQRSSLLVAEPAGEGAFAASNSSLAIAPGTKRLYLGTGGQGGARIICLSFEGSVLHEVSSLQVPIGSASASAGVFSLAFRDAQHGVAVGGGFDRPEEGARTAAWTSDGGQHWQAAELPPPGYRSAVAWNSASKRWITIGITGTDESLDDGSHWSDIDEWGGYALSLPWAVGPEGRVGRFAGAEKGR